MALRVFLSSTDADRRGGREFFAALLGLLADDGRPAG